MYIDIALQEFIDYNLHFKGHTKETVRGYRNSVMLLCKSLGIKCFSEVTDEHVRSFFYQGRLQHNWQPATFRTYYKSLMMFFRWSVERGFLSTNPIALIERPKLQKKLPPKLNKQDAQRLLEYAYNQPYESSFLRARNHAIFATFIYAGLRKSELLHLRLTDVDVQNMTVFVSQGKGAKDRIVPMSTGLAQSLRRYLDERKRLKRTCPEFFVSYNHDMGFTDHGLKHLVQDMRARSKIQFGVHKLRHTFATLMLEGGCDIYSLSRMMGHSDISTTTIYLAASPEHLRSQMVKHPLNQQHLY